MRGKRFAGAVAAAAACVGFVAAHLALTAWEKWGAPPASVVAQRAPHVTHAMPPESSWKPIRATSPGPDAARAGRAVSARSVATRVEPVRPTCTVPVVPADAKVFALGAYTGGRAPTEPLPGGRGGRIDVKVVEDARPVVLVLVSGHPAEWVVARGPRTRIAAVLTMAEDHARIRMVGGPVVRAIEPASDATVAVCGSSAELGSVRGGSRAADEAALLGIARGLLGREPTGIEAAFYGRTFIVGDRDRADEAVVRPDEPTHAAGGPPPERWGLLELLRQDAIRLVPLSMSSEAAARLAPPWRDGMLAASPEAEAFLLLSKSFVVRRPIRLPVDARGFGEGHPTFYVPRGVPMPTGFACLNKLIELD